jgi:acetylornithine deacetylase/succinyl-diaminopimelate desuccinylase-like protein
VSKEEKRKGRVEKKGRKAIFSSRAHNRKTDQIGDKRQMNKVKSEADMLAAARSYARAHQEEELSLLRNLAKIPAPSGHEEGRTTFVANWLRAQRTARGEAPLVEVTPEKDVLCWLGAGPKDPRPLAIFAAHLDIAFADTKALPLTEDESRLYAPGIGDDTGNLAGLLMATKELLANPQLLPQQLQILVVADSCEEGLGNLAGTKGLFSRLSGLGKKIESFVTFDLYLPQCISIAVGSLRFRISVITQGGHSYHDFGRPNAIETLCGLIETLYHSSPAQTLPAPVTYNVGKIEGGSAINAIAAKAKALFEYRSTSEEALKIMRTQLEGVVREEQKRPGVHIALSDIGARPASASTCTATQRALSSRAAQLIYELNKESPDLSPASTDANVPLSLGIPALCVGTVRGALLHTRKEWIDKKSLIDGLTLIFCLMANIEAETETSQ